MVSATDWRRAFATRWNVAVTTECFGLRDFLWTTRCSRIKSPRSEGTPKELYRSPLNIYFYRNMEVQGLRYGVISDEYGLHMDNEIKPSYDLHPSLLSRARKMELGKLVRERLKAEGFRGVIFYNNSPLRSVPYLDILSFAKVPVVFTTRLILPHLSNNRGQRL